MISNREGLVFLLLGQLFYGWILVKGDTGESCFRYTSFGYGYRDFFEFRGGNIPSNYVFYFSFYVKTVSDAHILLKSTVSGNDSLEIVIGGGSNTFSQIRLLGNEEKKTVLTQKTESILSETNYRKFLISIDKLGIIFVQYENDIFLNWRFDNLFPIKYYAFGSWTNTKADWKFGCDQHTEVIHDESLLTPMQKLKNDLFTIYNPNTAPNGPSNALLVKAEFLLTNVHMNEKRGELTLHGSGVLEWQDNKMKWDPKNYDGIDHLFIPPFQIWTPYLRVLNTLAIEKTPLFDLTSTGVIVTHEGSIFWRPPFKSVSSCEVDLLNWPYDIHNCTVLIGFWMEPSNLLLTIMVGSEKEKSALTGSGWNIFGATSLSPGDDNYGILYVELQRNQEPEVLLLTIPCIASDVLSLSSFWVPFDSPNKFYLSCGSVIMLLITLFFMGQAIPTMTAGVPKILTLYSWSVVLACFPILTFVLLKNFPKILKLPESFERILNHSLMDRMCCLSELPRDVSEYGNLNEEANKMQGNYINAVRLTSLIEKIFFLVYVCMLTARYILL